MIKTNTKKLIIFAISGIAVVVGFIYDYFFCFSKYYQDCMLDNYRLVFFEPLIIVSIFIFLTSVFTFFISNNIFKKWLIFSLIWFSIDAILVYNASVYSHYALDIIPTTKESISIWMGSLFVIISILMFIIMTINERRKK